MRFLKLMIIDYCKNSKPLKNLGSYESVICNLSSERCVADYCVADAILEIRHIDLMAHQYNPQLAKRCPCYSKKPYSDRFIRALNRRKFRETGLVQKLRNLRNLGLLINRG